MKKAFYYLLITLCPFCLFAQQVTSDYLQIIKQADSFYTNKQYKEAVKAYTYGFSVGNRTVLISDLYNAICAMAHAGMPDSAFSKLNMLAEKIAFSEYEHLIGDSDLISLHNDLRWDELCKKVKENKNRKDQQSANLNKPLVSILDTIYNDDQDARARKDEAIKKQGVDADEVKKLTKSLREKDSLNQIKVEGILDKYGWLGPEVIGHKGSRTIFLVIQHADIKTQEKYLPMMRDAVKNKKASASNLALLEDRILLRKGKKQLYGSQIAQSKTGEYYIQPLDDPDNVDKRRAEVGLEPFSDYVQRWKLKWSAEEYKKQLPEIEKKQKEIFN